MPARRSCEQQNNMILDRSLKSGHAAGVHRALSCLNGQRRQRFGHQQQYTQIFHILQTSTVRAGAYSTILGIAPCGSLNNVAVPILGILCAVGSDRIRLRTVFLQCAAGDSMHIDGDDQPAWRKYGGHTQSVGTCLADGNRGCVEGLFLVATLSIQCDSQSAPRKHARSTPKRGCISAWVCMQPGSVDAVVAHPAKSRHRFFSHQSGACIRFN